MFSFATGLVVPVFHPVFLHALVELIAAEGHETTVVARPAPRLKGLQLDHVLLDILEQDNLGREIPDLDEVELGRDQVLAI